MASSFHHNHGGTVMLVFIGKTVTILSVGVIVYILAQAAGMGGNSHLLQRQQIKREASVPRAPVDIRQKIGQKDTPIVRYGSGRRPDGQYDYCRRHGWDCKLNSHTAIVRWNERTMAMVESVNQQVNVQIRPAVGDNDGRSTDRIIFGVDEKWAYTEEDGDCEDVALKKRWELMQKNFPASALLLTVVSADPKNGPYDHIVLTIRTDVGDFILDNNSNELLPWYKVPYKYVLRQNAKDRTAWDVLDDPRVSQMASR